MKESIYIQNIGPLRNIELDHIKPFTLIIGESASGKSTLMKVLAQFRYFYKIAVIRSWLKNAHVKGTYFKIKIEEFWRRAGLQEMIKASSVVVYTVTEGENKYVISYRNGKLAPLPTIPNSNLQFFKISFISQAATIDPQTVRIPNTTLVQSGIV